jgi:hypothetical protein
MIKGLVAVTALLYLTYLLAAAWGIGSLAMRLEGEVDRLSCKPDCRLYNQGFRNYRKSCIKYCK